MLAGILGLLLLVCVLVYLPPVQRFAVRKAAAIVSERTGMQLSVEKFRLRFPLGISVNGAALVTPAGDTLAGVGRLRLDVSLPPLLAGEIRATGITLENASTTYRDTVSDMLLRARADLFTVRSATLGLRNNSVRISRASLDGAVARLDIGEGAQETETADTTAAAWKFRLRRFDLSDVKFTMNISSPQESRLAVDLPRGVIRRASVDLDAQEIDVLKIRLTEGDYGYFTGDAAPAEKREDAGGDSAPWTVRAGSVELERSRAAYGSMTGSPSPGLDFRHIRAHDLNLLAEDIHYHGEDISAQLRRLELTERSGLRIIRGKAGFSMNGDGFSLNGLDLATENSEIRADAEAGAGIMSMSPSTPVSAAISASVGAGDISLFAPSARSLQRAMRGRPLTVEGNFGGTLGDLSIDNLTAGMPGHAQMNIRGNLRSITAPENLRGQVSFNGTLRDIAFVKGFIADTALRRRIGFPGRMTLRGRAAFSPGTYEISCFTLAADTGRLDLDARLAMRSREYRADVELTDFPLHLFLPHDSLGVATLSLDVRGSGFDPSDGMDADVDLKIDRLDYRGFAYHDMELAACMYRNRLRGRLTSANEALSLDLRIRGLLAEDSYRAGIRGDIWRADIHRMGFSPDTLAFTTQLDIRAEALRDTSKMRFNLDAEIDSTVVRYGKTAQRIDLTRIKAESGSDRTSANVTSGDLRLDFMSRMPLDSLAAGFGSMGDEIKRQLAARNLSMDSLQRAIPCMKLTASAGQGNILRYFAESGGVDFYKLSADVSTFDGEPFRAYAEINGLRTAGLTLDTLSLRMSGRDDRFNYALRLANRPGNVENLALIWVYGQAGGNAATLNVYQRNRADSVGFRFGLAAELLENSVRASMTPREPVLGYKKWTINDGNYVEYGFDGKLHADLRLKGPEAGRYVTMSSASMKDIPEGALRLEMAGINMDYLTDLYPTAPPLGGMLSSDLTFGFSDGVIAAKGELGIGDFTYDRRRVADIDARVDFQSDNAGRMALDAGVDIDRRTALTAGGYYTKERMDFAVGLEHIPLSAADAFLPPGVVKLSGSLDGDIRIDGHPSAPHIGANVGFNDGRAVVDMLGTAYGFSEDRITVADDILNFNGFGIVAPNREKMSIEGTVDLSDLSRMLADLRIAARNFQAVNSTHTGGSQIYGNAMLDLGVTLRGTFDNLTVRGNVDLLRNTDVVYILRNQSQNVRDERQNIVEFTVFADSLYTAAMANVSEPFRRRGTDMLVGVNIDEGLRATLSLDEQNENRVELVGGGRLSYSMNTQGDMRLSGRYTLSGGTVYYRPPLIAQKIFAVKSGSFVEWVGEPDNPSFNVTATQTMNVDITNEGQVRFDISIIISGSLQTIEILFDVTAPEHKGIENELLSLTPEQRMSQALSLLLYGQYTGAGFSSEATFFDARDQLNNFISREINQWARNSLRGVDLSVGISTSDDLQGNTSTDYSYSISKRLFSDRVTVTIGGRLRDNGSSQDFSDNLVEDIILEYRLTKRDNIFLKVYRFNTRQSILEGEVTETGAGFVIRKKMNRFGDLFRWNRDAENRRRRLEERERRRQLRHEEKSVEADGTAAPGNAPPPGDPSDPARIQRQY